MVAPFVVESCALFIDTDTCRLNGKQSLELAFHIANRLRRDQGLPPMVQP